MSKLIQLFTLLILIVLLIACSNLPLKPATPKISLADFRLLNLGLLEQNYRLRLRLNNPNPFPLPITQFNYQVRINDQEFTQGKNNQAITLPALGEEFLDINVTSNLMQLLGQWQDWKTLLKRRFRYQLVGGVNVVDWAPQLPFDYQGEVALFWGENPTHEKK